MIRDAESHVTGATSGYLAYVAGVLQACSQALTFAAAASMGNLIFVTHCVNVQVSEAQYLIFCSFWTDLYQRSKVISWKLEPSLLMVFFLLLLDLLLLSPNFLPDHGC